MENEEVYINPELRGILEEFTRIRDAYVGLKTCCEIQEETFTIEKERSEHMREQWGKLLETYRLLEKRYKSIIAKLEAERDGLLKTNEDLKEQCDHLRLINADRNGNYEQTGILEDEIEVLKAQLAMQEEKHNEDTALLKQKHSDETQKYKVLLRNAKQASTSGESKKRGRTKNVKNNNYVPSFRWPELDVEKINNTPIEEEGEGGNKKKRRKLFHEDKETGIDIV